MTNNKFHKFMTTPLGGLVKHFLFIILTLWLVDLQAGNDIFKGDWKMWNKYLTAGVVACLPVVLNWLNPNYKNYGK